MSGISICKSLELHLVQPGLVRSDIVDACQQASAAHLASVTVLPVHVNTAAAACAGRDTRVTALIGYPWGQETLSTRLHAIEQARVAGADSVAITLDRSLLTTTDLAAAQRELATILEQTGWSSLVNTKGQGTVTIVTETMQLDPVVLEAVCDVLDATSASFLQTSSGSSAAAVTEDHIRMLRGMVPADVGIIATGGVGTLEAAVGLINAGAVRIGSRSALAIAKREQMLREERAPL